MRRFIGLLAVAVMVSSIGVSRVIAAEQGNYVPGVEGIKAASLPPPGFYWRIYNAFYNSGTLKDGDGEEVPIGFDVNVYALVNRFIYVSPKKFLGANYVCDIIIPLQHTGIEIAALGVDDSKFALGDIAIEPFVLAWHGARYDAAFGLGFYVPTGSYDITEPASPGKDHCSLLMTMGLTTYFDPEKTWSFSALSRFESHAERDKAKISPGSNLVIEWGLAKNAAKVWDIGLAGYMQWQLADDSGTGVDYDKTVHDKAYAIGPEVLAFIPSAKMFFSVRSLFEFGVEDRSQGNITTVTLTKIF